ncbi:hypothetical protein RHMOL_Rhmol09G0188100 [Rhododendron molle]|uniref:Uncharacterized protein n=1 Tax=Rhododendron molle TaxID=49168 RepID=A0ACC0MEV2_RHOML|nr:hypothetical protein RHMOL_Rhmol09G0188100 [Rhododendron molle]
MIPVPPNGDCSAASVPSLSTAPSPPPPLLLPNRRNPLRPGGTRCRSIGHSDRSVRPHWDSKSPTPRKPTEPSDLGSIMKTM